MSVKHLATAVTRKRLFARIQVVVLFWKFSRVRNSSKPPKDGAFICKGLQTSNYQTAKERPTTTSKTVTTTKESAVEVSTVKPSRTTRSRTTTRTTTQTTTTRRSTSTTTTATTLNDQFLTKTVSGHVCQAWNVQRPHRHKFGYVGSHNFCRNPENKPFGVWCYTTNPNVRWERCTQAGEYVMTEEEKATEFVSKTVSGRTCQAWNKQWPHKHGYTFTGNHNFCRNPTNYSRGNWCLTTDPRKKWELCKAGKLIKLQCHTVSQYEV